MCAAQTPDRDFTLYNKKWGMWCIRVVSMALAKEGVVMKHIKPKPQALDEAATYVVLMSVKGQDALHAAALRPTNHGLVFVESLNNTKHKLTAGEFEWTVEKKADVMPRIMRVYELRTRTPHGSSSITIARDVAVASAAPMGAIPDAANHTVQKHHRDDGWCARARPGHSGAQKKARIQ